MAFFGLIKDKPQLKTEFVKANAFGSDLQAFNINYETAYTPLALYKTSYGFLNGINGQFPQELNHLSKQSPTHSAILNIKKLLTVGAGFSAYTANLSGAEIIAYNQLAIQFEEILDSVGMDYHTHAKVCLDIDYNSDKTKILKVKRVAPEKIRINDVSNEMKPLNFLSYLPNNHFLNGYNNPNI